MLPAAVPASAALPALTRKPRRSIGELLLISCSCPFSAPSGSVCGRQPDSEALLERFRYKKCASATSCDTSPVVWTRMRSSSRSRPFFAPETSSWISP